jgi:hypothetical protein
MYLKRKRGGQKIQKLFQRSGTHSCVKMQPRSPSHLMSIAQHTSHSQTGQNNNNVLPHSSKKNIILWIIYQGFYGVATMCSFV